MYPSIDVFGRVINTYSILAVIGGIAAGFVGCRLAKRRKLDDNNVIIILLLCAVGGFIGGKILYGITMLPNISKAFALVAPADLAGWVKFLKWLFNGLVFYGGLIGGMLVGYGCCRVAKLDFGGYSDVIIVTIPLFHFFGRIGCFLSGCCYGIESRFGLMTTHSVNPAADGVTRFPVQLLEAGVNLMIFFLLYRLFVSGKMKNRLMYLYLLIYPTVRFFDEFLRGDNIRGRILFLSTSQFISVLLIIFALIMLLVKHGKKIKKTS